MKKHGFQEVYCEDFDFAGQVRLFESADFICGPSGAAWTNIVFCKPKTKALSWLPTITQDFSAFSTLGHAVGVDFQFIFCKPVNNSKLHTAYEVDCTELEKQVKAMLA